MDMNVFEAMILLASKSSRLTFEIFILMQVSNLFAPASCVSKYKTYCLLAFLLLVSLLSVVVAWTTKQKVFRPIVPSIRTSCGDDINIYPLL